MLEKLKALQNVCLTIQHNDHALLHQSLEDWLFDNAREDGCYDVTPEDWNEILRTGECWTLQWYPNTPVGFNAVAAATLERCIELAAEV